MAFLQHDFPPSTAPGSVRAIASDRSSGAAAPRTVVRPVRRRVSGARVALAIVAAAAVMAPGYFVLRDTESWALGILASDFTFLIGVAIASVFSRR